MRAVWFTGTCSGKAGEPQRKVVTQAEATRWVSSEPTSPTSAGALQGAQERRSSPLPHPQAVLVPPWGLGTWEVSD